MAYRAQRHLVRELVRDNAARLSVHGVGYPLYDLTMSGVSFLLPPDHNPGAVNDVVGIDIRLHDLVLYRGRARIVREDRSFERCRAARTSPGTACTQVWASRRATAPASSGCAATSSARRWRTGPQDRLQRREDGNVVVGLKRVQETEKGCFGFQPPGRRAPTGGAEGLTTGRVRCEGGGMRDLFFLSVAAGRSAMSARIVGAGR